MIFPTPMLVQIFSQNAGRRKPISDEKRIVATRRDAVKGEYGSFNVTLKKKLGCIRNMNRGDHNAAHGHDGTEKGGTESG